MRSDRSSCVTYEDLMKPDEDWRNVRNNAERRKLQNRIAQRAYRRNMRERTQEVGMLKQKIRELQDNPWDAAAFSEFGNNLSIFDNALGESQSVSVSSKRNDASGEDSEQINTGWRQTSEPDGLIALHSALRPKSPQNPEASASLSDLVRPDSMRMSPQPQMPLGSTKCRQPLPTKQAEHKGVPSKGGQDLRGPSPISSQPAGAGHAPTLLEGTNAVPAPTHAQPALASVDVDNLSLWPEFYGRLPRDVSNPVPSATPSLSRSNASAPSPTKFDRPELGTPPLCKTPTLLHLAVEAGNAGTLQLLLQTHEICTSKKDSAGYTPLQRAVMKGRSDLVAILLEYGADIASDDDISDMMLDAEIKDLDFM